MSVVVFGSTELTQLVAAEVHASADLELAGVVHAPPEFRISYAPAGFRSTRFTDVGAWARDQGVPTAQQGADDLVAFARGCGATLALVAGWYHNLPRALIAAFPRGAVGLHASLLPELRGHAPLPWAILLGLERTGVSLFVIDPDVGVDEGGLHGQASFAIERRAHVAELVAAAGAASVELVRTRLADVLAGAPPEPQMGTPSYGLHRTPADGHIDWSVPATAIDRLVRAVSRPYPGAFSVLGGTCHRVWQAEPRDDLVVHGAVGQVAHVAGASHPVVVTGSGCLELLEVTDDGGSDLVPALRRANHLRFEPRTAASP
jgi:methionyl-tRNA formyltransferase